MQPPWLGRRVAHWVGSWAERSQLGSRRNAMVAATALTQRRVEREDVEAFLSASEPPATPYEVEVTAAAR